jgi:hypothetical protein
MFLNYINILKNYSFYDHRTASRRRRVFEKRTKSGPTRNEES